MCAAGAAEVIMDKSEGSDIKLLLSTSIVLSLFYVIPSSHGEA